MDEKKYQLQKLELNALLEITQAINANLPEESLYKIYHFTLLANLNVGNHALFVKEEGFACKVSKGKDRKKLKLPKELLKLKETKPIAYKSLEGLNLAIPVKHKDELLAVILIENNNKEELDISFVETLSNIILVAIENKKLARQQLQQEVLKKELEIASQVQNLLFPSELPGNERISIKADYIPHQSVGGDYYDYIPLGEDKFLLCIADVSGKGVPAAMIMSNFQACLRTMSHQTDNLEKIIHELNFITRTNANGERFITVFLCKIDMKRKTLDYINAGHNPPFLHQKGQGFTTLSKGTTVIGAFPELPFLEQEQVALDGMVTLFSFTDGVTETINSKKEEFGPELLLDIISDNIDASTELLHKIVLKKLNDFKGDEPYADDVTLLSCKLNVRK